MLFRSEGKKIFRDRLASRFRWLDSQLADKQYLMGGQFSVADGYLFAVIRWAKPMAIDLTPFPNLVAWRERVNARPAVQAALAAEGLLK